jgi:phosphatidylethanolamine-binding protein (PEBP) family uncharacterized protein
MKLALCAIVIAGAALPQATPQPIAVGSPTLQADRTMPRDYSSPRQSVTAVDVEQSPAATKEVAVVCQDPDAGNPPPRALGDLQDSADCERAAGRDPD